MLPRSAWTISSRPSTKRRPTSIIHGYQGGPGWLDVTAELVGDSIVITIADDGAAVRSDARARARRLTIPPISARPGGMGVHLIRLATDSMTYRRGPAAAIY